MGQYWTLGTKNWTWTGINKQGLKIYHFRVILGRRFQIRREKKFWNTPRASIGLIVKNIDMTSPVLPQGVVRNFFSRRNWILRPKITLKRCIWSLYQIRPIQVLSIEFIVQYWPRKWPEKNFLSDFKIYTINMTSVENFNILA